MDNLEFIKWYGHASFSFIDEASGNCIYYVDPFDITDHMLEIADIVFITHAHQDHLSPPDIKAILKDDTVIIAPTNCIDKLQDFPNETIAVEPNQPYTVKEFSFRTIPAYNIKPERLSAHPKENNWVGYIFVVNGKKMYHAGDTDFIPEMDSLTAEKLDIAMLPIGGKFTMNVDEAILAANKIGAKITIPMHYKRLLGDTYKEAEEAFKHGVTNSEVIILEEVK